MKRNAFVIVFAAGFVALAAWQLAPAEEDRPVVMSSQVSPVARTAFEAPANTIAPATAAGYVAHFDESGQLIEEPVAGVAKEFEAALAQSINTSSEGLVEVGSPVAGGGTMVNLQGRFQSASAATIDASGKLTVPCLANEAEVESFTAAGTADQPAGKE
jgi:hypothetical protein